MVQRVANGNLIFDLDNVVRVAALANITPEEVINRLTSPEDPISRMPFLAQMRQLLFARLRNKTLKWEANDLVDIMFLGCASGYADIVVGERSTIAYLRQARTPRSGVRLATSLTEAVALLTERSELRLVHEPSPLTAVSDLQPSAADVVHCPFAREGATRFRIGAQYRGVPLGANIGLMPRARA